MAVSAQMGPQGLQSATEMVVLLAIPKIPTLPRRSQEPLAMGFLVLGSVSKEEVVCSRGHFLAI